MSQPPPSKRSKLTHGHKPHYVSKQPILKQPSTKRINLQDDPRFASLLNGKDPRFRSVSHKKSKVKLDARFAPLLHDERFSSNAKVDRYGRQLPESNARKELEKFYELEQENEEASSEDSDGLVKGSGKPKANRNVESAREDGVMPSESEDESSSEDSVSSDEEIEVFGPSQHQESADAIPVGEVSKRLAVMNLDWDHIRAADIMAVLRSFVPAGKGRIDHVAIYPSEFGKERMQREEMEGPPKELFALKKQQSDDLNAASKALNEIHAESSDEEDSVMDEGGDISASDEDEKIKNSILKEDEGVEFSSVKLRRYQLDRLRYFYAVVTCSSSSVSQTIYDTVDGTEYLSTANFFDLRFIPDETDFSDDRVRDECNHISADYKPTEFVTDALQHSKVRLTWDADDNERKEAQKRAFKGGRRAIDENDLKAYLASDSSDDDAAAPDPIIVDATDDVPGPNVKVAETIGPLLDPGISKKEAARRKMRALLGLPEDADSRTKDEPEAGDMQVTWGAFGDEDQGAIIEDTPLEAQETTAEKYVRKEKERKAKRKEKMKAKRSGVENTGSNRAAVEKGKTAQELHGSSIAKHGKQQEADLGFQDPFFNSATQNTEADSKSKAKLSKREKRRLREAEEPARANPSDTTVVNGRRPQDENTKKKSDSGKETARDLNNEDDDDDDLNHFNINDLARAEKLKQKKRKAKHLSQRDRAALDAKEGDRFEMNPQDARFSALYERPEFAVDPTHPRFLDTEGMRKVMAEKTRRATHAEDADSNDAANGHEGSRQRRRGGSGGDDEVARLVRSIKRK